MVEYQVMVSIDQHVEQEWLHWMQTSHIPDVLRTGYFSQATLLRQDDPPTQTQQTTYHIRYLCSSVQRWEEYQNNAAPALQAEHTQRYLGRFSAKRSLHQVCSQWDAADNTKF